MKTFSLVSTLRKASIALALTVFAAMPAWADKYASIVVDMDSNTVLHARQADEQRYPASLTKVMTLYLVFDAVDAGKLKLSERIPVSANAAKQQPSKLGMTAGSTIKVEDAIRALVTKSANDVAVVLAEKLGGTEAKFVAKMNAKAKELGLENTTFKNASGLPHKAQVTTARDMAKLAEAMFLDHKDRYNYFSLASFTWNKRKYENHNTLLKKVKGVDGIKTGYTNASGYNLMASAERDGRRVIAVMMGGTTGKSRDAHVADLLEAAFLEIEGQPLTDDSDLRNQIAFGGRGNASADELAMAQLRKLTPPEDARLVAAADSEAAEALLASVEADSTEENGLEGFEVAQGDGDEAAASPAPAAASMASSGETGQEFETIEPAAMPVSAAISAPVDILVTSEYQPS